MDNNFNVSGDGVFLYHHFLANHKGIIHGFSLRKNPISGQGQSHSPKGYYPEAQVAQNRQQLICSLLGHSVGKGIPDFRLITLKQVHSDEILVLEDRPLLEIPITGDGLVTAQPGVFLAVQTADCMPVLVLDPQRKVVAAVHAGWRGTVKRIIEKTIRKMQARLGSDAADCIAVVGPSIRQCCYLVGQEVIAAFHAEFSYAPSLFSPSRLEVQSPQEPSALQTSLFLDLPRASKQQLLDSGLLEANISADPPCTACDTRRFFSHRAESGHCGRMTAVIGIIQG
jgi:YfiH family protein